MRVELLNEIDALIEAIASKLPASMSNKENMKLEAAFKKSMSNYFSSLAEAFPYQNLEQLYLSQVREGGEGSGNFGHEGRPGEVGGSGEGDGITVPLSARAERARASHKSATVDVQRQGESNEPRLAKAILGTTNHDNEAFDVVSADGKNVFEVKTIVRGKNDKITMHPPSLARKIDYVNANNVTAHTVVFDDRVGKIYYKAGLGSFRLNAMESISSLSEIRGKFN